ncbi:hypothetical protein [Botrimarina hoheduenensis]|uniref:Uncharacterized protein n=1 Tax=Botrimarina hoheduenensis TaxID=2528000 RepID=A0A5C5WCY1_9BACT|nr:hypothetical protein [Botrimarina hoheduenensis]TWT48788.1 hypothetical protein Pla111_05630 [Botrimarina hoheduenensis]
MLILKSFAAALLVSAVAAPAAARGYVVYAPIVAPPVVVAPVAPTIVYRPVTPYFAAQPVVATVPAPVVAVPAPTLQPVVTTRYRPILGGAVSRVRYRYAPGVVVAPLY